MFELTFKCYTDCICCYADRSHQNSKELLPLEKVISIIREAKESGIVDLDINGGEILLHPYSKEILKELAANKYMPLISTKLPLKRETLETLKELGMLRVQISLDSLCLQTLMKQLKVDKTYRDKILNTMQMLDEMGFHWQVNMILTDLNKSLEEEIKPLIQKLVQYKNIRSIRVGPAGCSLYKPMEYFNRIKLKVNMLPPLRQYISQVALENPGIQIGISEPDCEFQFKAEVKKEAFVKRSTCTGNQRSIVILPDGKVTICEELYWHPQLLIGDLKRQSILEVWSSQKALDLFYIRTTSISEKSACKHCEDFSTCRHFKGVCWKMILMAYGKENWDYPDPRCPKAPKPENEFYLV